MRHFRKIIAVLLLAAVALLPVSGLGEETVNAFDTLRVLMEMEFDEGLPPAQGESIYTEVDDDTAQGLLCTIVYGDEENASVMMIAGINGEGKYEMRTYSDLTSIQLFYYSYLVCRGYSFVKSEMPAGEDYSVIISFGSEDDDIILIDSEDKAEAIAETIRNALESAGAAEEAGID